MVHAAPTNRPNRLLASLLAGVLVCTWAPLPAGSSGAASEEAVKAAYVYNFIKFTDWPEQAFADDRQRLVLCSDASGAMRSALEALSGRTAKMRQLEIRPLPAQRLDHCHVALLNNPANLGRLDTAQPVLTVHDLELPPGEEHGIVQLFRAGTRLSFAIDLRAARRASLHISAKLLTVAAEVID